MKNAQQSGAELVSVVIPIFNEEAVIPELYRRLTSVLEQLGRYEVIFVNDGSTDQSLALLRRLCADDDRLRIIDFSRNFGHQLALTAGLHHTKGNAVIIMDGDLQDPPEVIPKLLARWNEGYEVVYAQRRARKGEGTFKLQAAKAFYRLINRWSSVSIPLDTGDFRLMDRRVVDELNRMGETSRFIRGMVSWVGFRQVAVTFDRDARFAGTPKYSVRKSIRLAWDGICSASTFPLTVATYMGVLATTIGLICSAVVGARVALGHAVAGWMWLTIVVLFLGGVQLVSVGLLGQYIGRIFNESVRRPLYVVRERYGFHDRRKNGSDAREGLPEQDRDGVSVPEHGTLEASV